MILSGKEILKRLTMVAPLSTDTLPRVTELVREGKIVISPFPDVSKILETVCLTLEIGKIKIPESPSILKEICIDFSKPESLEQKFEIFDKEKAFLHPNPREFLIIETRQFLGVPTDLIAQITIGGEFAKYGLVLREGIVFLQPGSVGRVVLNVRNFGDRPMALSEGLPIFQVMFQTLSTAH